MGHRRAETSDQRPFGLPWLDSCYQETLLPEAPWHQVRDLLCDSLAQKVEKHLNNEKRRQMIFEMMGPRFAQKYFPNVLNDPSILEPPRMTPEARQKVVVDTMNWLQVAVHQAATDVHCQRPEVIQDEDEDVAAEMEDFLHHTKSVVTKGLERHLYLQEEVLVKKKKSKMEALDRLREDRELWAKWQRAEQRRQQTSHVKGILKNPQPPASLPTTGSGLGAAAFVPPPTPQIKADMYVPESQPPLWGYQADSLGRSLVGILKRDPRRFAEIAWRLHGRQLPASLRNYVWLDVLLMANREDHKGSDVNVEKVVRERFGKMVSRGMEEMRVTRATHSPISSLIDKAVIEVYDNTPGMKGYLVDNNHMKDASKALNVLYCFDRSYEPYLIYWLFPLQLAFREQAGEREQAYEMSLYLHLLSRACFPRWPEVFSLAESVIESLRIADEELLLHLKEVAGVDPNLDTKNFMIELLHRERSKAEQLKKKASSSVKDPDNSALLFIDPLIYIRKWIGEGFVSVLDTPAVLWLWDQLFMEKWDRKILIDACLALLLLLKHKFMEATDHASMAQVFQSEPCKLYTKDIQRAWMHLQYGGQPHEVPPFNRRRPKPPAGSAAGQPLDPVGIKGVVVNVVFTEDTARKERWVAGFDPEDVKVLSTVYFGSTCLASQVSTKPARCPMGARQLDQDTTAYKIYFLKTALEFPSLDPSSLDVEAELGAQPYAVIQADYYGHEDTKAGRALPITLGWARVPLYVRQADDPQGGWVVSARSEEFTLNPGAVPDTLSVDGDEVPPPVQPVYIQAGSKMNAKVFDLRFERPPSPTPTELPAREPTPVRSPDSLDVNSTFDMYIDGVENIPDNATITKVTGRVIKTGELSGIPDLLILPEMKTSARSPAYRHRVVVNKDKLTADKDMLVLLRVYTVDKNPKEVKPLCVIGSCMFGLYDSKGYVRMGGHQCVLHIGMPDLSKGVGVLNPAGLDDAPRIPACSIKIRIAPTTDKMVEAPVDPDFYKFDGTELNESEINVAESYASDPKTDPNPKPNTDAGAEAAAIQSELYPLTVNDMVKRLQELEGAASGEAPRIWLRDRLNQKKHLAANQPADNLPLPLMVEYRMPVGVSVQVTQAYGLPGGRYTHCYVRLAPGSTAAHKTPTREGYGKKDQFFTTTHDYDAPQKAPVWTDKPTVIHPHRDWYNCLVLQLIGLKAVYHPTDDHNSPGHVTNKGGAPVSLDAESTLGWAIVPLMKRRCVWSGLWRVPVLTKRPDAEFFDALSKSPVQDVFQQHQWAPADFLDGASVDVKVVDGHFAPEHLPQGFKKQDVLLDIVGAKERCAMVRQEKAGKPLYNLVLSSLGKKYQKLGTKSFVFEREKEFFIQVMEQTFTGLMNEAIRQSKKPPPPAQDDDVT